MTSPILPTANALFGAAKLHLATIRPTAKAHVESGRYASVLEGFKNQEQLCLARVAAEIAAARVPTSGGQELVELLQSEFDANIVNQPTHAVGEVEIWRATQGTPGLIRAGTRFRRKGDKNTSPLRQDAIYESTEPVYVGSLDGAAASPVVVPVRCVQAGTIGNMPYDWSTPSSYFSIVDTIFDSSFKVSHAYAAGGSDNLDTKLKQLGKYLTQGQYGPNLAAIVAGLLSTPGVSRFAVSENLAEGSVNAWIADDSWATSGKLRSLALQTLQDGWLGWGCKVNIGIVRVLPIAIHSEVVLRDKRFAGDTSEILANIRAAVRGYFNNRDDWYTWTHSGIFAAIVGSDRRIARARSCAVRYALTGAAVATPSTMLWTNASTQLVHYHVDDTNVQITLQTPSST